MSVRFYKAGNKYNIEIEDKQLIPCADKHDLKIEVLRAIDAMPDVPANKENMFARWWR